MTGWIIAFAVVGIYFYCHMTSPAGVAKQAKQAAAKKERESVPPEVRCLTCDSSDVERITKGEEGCRRCWVRRPSRRVCSEDLQVSPLRCHLVEA